jgi:RNA recognition motif-containing protein
VWPALPPHDCPLYATAAPSAARRYGVTRVRIANGSRHGSVAESARQHQGYGFAEFQTRAAAEAAILALDKLPAAGKTLKVGGAWQLMLLPWGHAWLMPRRQQGPGQCKGRTRPRWRAANRADNSVPRHSHSVAANCLPRLPVPAAGSLPAALRSTPL